MPDSGDNTVMVRVRCDSSLRDKFKGLCAMNSTNMNAVLTEFMEKYVRTKGNVEVVERDRASDK